MKLNLEFNCKMYTKIWSKLLTDYIVTDANSEHPFISLKRFNLFIGINNSGKSRLIRTLLNSSEKELQYHSDYIDTIQKPAMSFLSIYAPTQELKVSDKAFLSRQEADKLLKSIPITNSDRKALYNKYNQSLMPLRTDSNLSLGLPSNIFSDLREKVKQNIINTLITDLENQRHLYIPILRGMRSLHEDIRIDVFANRTVKDYFKNTNLNPKIHEEAFISPEDKQKKLKS